MRLQKSTKTKLDLVIHRAYEIGLTFNQIYFIAFSDYPSEGSVKTLRAYLEDGSITEYTFTRMVKDMPNEFA